MKNKCPVCNAEKARRDCVLKDGARICSRCCAEMRGSECGECPHYVEAMRHALQREADLPEGDYIVEINPEVLDAVNDALELAIQGKITKAFTAMELLADEHPRNHDVCFGMGALYAVIGKSAEAIPWFEKAVSIFPYMAEAHFNLGVAHKKTGHLGRMIKSFRKAVEYGDPQEEYYADAKEQLEHAKEIIGKNEGVDLDRYVASSEKFEAAYELMENGQWEAAAEGFKAVAILNEKNAPTHGNLGICLGQLGRKAEALAALDRALEIDPGYEPAIGNRRLVERMVEGVPLGGKFESVNYSAEKLEKLQKRRNAKSGS